MRVCSRRLKGFRSFADNGRARKVRIAKSHGQGKRGKLSGAAPVVRPLGAKRKHRIPNHEKIVVITHTTLETASCNYPEPSNDPHHHSLSKVARWRQGTAP